MDAIVPLCATEEGCPVPRPNPAGERALEIHDRIDRLRRLNLAAHICTVYGVNKQDLELLAVIEDELKESSPAGGEQEEDKDEV